MARSIAARFRLPHCAMVGAILRWNVSTTTRGCQRKLDIESWTLPIYGSLNASLGRLQRRQRRALRPRVLAACVVPHLNQAFMNCGVQLPGQQSQYESARIAEPVLHLHLARRRAGREADTEQEHPGEPDHPNRPL